MIVTTKTETGWTLQLNRPDKANALTRDMLEDLDAEVARAGEAGVPVLILTGAGKVFSAGADLEAARAGLTKDPVWERLSSRIAEYPGVTVAALNGTCAGGAIGMVLACDLRVAATGTKFFYPVLKNGFLPQPSDPQRLADLCGLSRAKQILLAGQRIDAETALNWGLLDRVVAPDQLMQTTQELTEAATTADPALVSKIKLMCDDRTT